MADQNTYELLKAAGFSDQEILADAGFKGDEIAQPQLDQTVSVPEAIGSAALKAGDALSFGFGSEIGAGGNALIDALTSDVSISDAYRQRKAAGDRALSLVNESTPGLSGTIEALGGFLNPISRLIPGGSTTKGALTKAAIEGGLYGVGNSEADTLTGMAKDFGKGAAVGGTTAGVLTGLAKGGQSIAEQAGKIGKRLEQSALVITAADRAKAVKSSIGKYMFEKFGEHPTDKMINTAKKYGIIKGDLDPEIMQLDTGKTIEKIGKELSGVLKAADKELDGSVRVSFQPVRDWIKANVSGTERKAIETDLGKEIKALAEEMDGTLQGLQRIKQNLYAKGYDTNASSAKNKFYKQLTRQIKQTIEDEVDGLAKAGKIDATLQGQIKRLNADEGDLLQMQKIFTRNAAKAGAQDPVKAITGAIRTTGGFGVPILAGAYSDNLPAGLAGAAAMYSATSPRGRMAIARALSQSAPTMGNVGAALNSRTNDIARALMAVRSGQ